MKLITTNIVLCFGLLATVKASVIFPFQQSTHHGNTSRRNRFKKGAPAKKKENTDHHWRQLRRAPSVSSSHVSKGDYGMIKSFRGVGPKSGGFLFFGATVIHLANRMRSESFKRAFDFWVHAGPIVLHYKFTRWFLTKTKAPLEKRDSVYNSLHNRYCGRSFEIVLRLQGLYVKIAQIVSSRPDFVPPQYIDLFIAAQDSIPQWPIEEVVNAIDTSLNSAFGLGFYDVFQSIESSALGSASIGQVHKAKLNSEYANLEGYNGGEIVAVKVMHRGAEERFHHDFQVFRWLCKIALQGWEPILDECYRQIMSEFDYRREAGSLARVRENMAKSPFHRRIRIPEPLSKLCSKELLIMEMLEGKNLSDAIEDELALALGGKDKAMAMIRRKRLELILGKDKLQALNKSLSDPVEKMIAELRPGKKWRLYLLYKQTERYINLLVDVQGHQILLDGLFQGDPHNGNILKMPDGCLGLIDYGQTKSISKEERLRIAQVVAALGEVSNEQEIANRMRDLGFKTKFNDDKILAKYAALFFDSDVDAKAMGCATPQLYFAKLTTADPLVHVPDVAIFVARASFILRGMGTLLDKQICTSTMWASKAREAIQQPG